MHAMTKPAPPRRTPLALSFAANLSTPAAKPDLVDHIFDYLSGERLLAETNDLELAKEALREYFGGTEVYIPKPTARARHALAVKVLSLFNGRNASEIARRLGMGRSTVYRIIKQAGPPGSL